SVNRVRNKELASRLASLLEGIEFPSSKGKIKDHIQHRSQILQRIEGSMIVWCSDSWGEKKIGSHIICPTSSHS
ncbi:MAG: hypothetical protein ACRD5B_08465, partial [Nitrososphaeraceae archaeon]